MRALVTAHKEPSLRIAEPKKPVLCGSTPLQRYGEGF